MSKLSLIGFLTSALRALVSISLLLFGAWGHCINCFYGWAGIGAEQISQVSFNLLDKINDMSAILIALTY